MGKAKFGFNKNNNKSDWVIIKFPNITKEQLENISKAEHFLRKAGIDFDTGYLFKENTREWEFDWSLKGAIVEIKKRKS